MYVLQFANKPQFNYSKYFFLNIQENTVSFLTIVIVHHPCTFFVGLNCLNIFCSRVLYNRCSYYLAPHRGRARYCNAHVCLCVCLFVCVCVCVFVCPCFRKISKCNISAISQPIIMKLGIHITYGYTVTDKYFQNFRSKVKVVGRRKVKNVIWPYLGNEWS